MYPSEWFTFAIGKGALETGLLYVVYVRALPRRAALQI